MPIGVLERAAALVRAQSISDVLRPHHLRHGCRKYGCQLESTAGTLKFATLYMLSGVFSICVSAVFAPKSVTVGASGALFGIFGAFLSELIQNWWVDGNV